MKITFHGVRGSYPVPGKQTVGYGGNTTCVSFSKDFDGRVHRLIVDCGTGAITLGREIVGNFFAKKEELSLTMLFSHLHPDHTQAFPFFAPNYFSECSIRLYGMKTLKKHVGSILEQSMLPPTFPIEYKDLKSDRKHFEVKDGDELEFPAKPARPVFRVKVMQAYAPSHPQQGAIYYRITDIETGKSAACIWDIESKQGGDKAVINFSKDCDVMIHDTQYTDEEYESDRLVVQGFGHSTYTMAIENARQAKIREKLICTHFNPAHSDEKLDSIQSQLSSKEKAGKDYTFETLLAKEGMEIEV